MKGPTVSMSIATVVAMLFSASACAEGDARGGADVYRVCVACHSLEAGIHLSGPSLAGSWGRPAAAAPAFDRYSEALRGLEIVWDEDTLNAWLADPGAMAPGTYMVFRGIESDTQRQDLIAFLAIAMQADGARTVIEDGLIPDYYTQGQVPENLREVDADRRITAMRHCRETYFVTTADGTETPYWETNVRLKTDASARGPQDGPVLIYSGMMGDRVSVVFSNIETMAAFITLQCE